jgi:hypothetical protein
MNAMLVKTSDRTQNIDAFKRQLVTNREVKRAVSTIRRYDSGKTPIWLKVLAPCLVAIIVTIVVLIYTGVIN